MFLKAFLVFSCLVLHTASMTTAKENEFNILKQLDKTITKINCSISEIQNVNLTRPDNLCPSHPSRQYTFCQISKALNGSSCTDESNMQQLQRLSRQMQGNVTCPLPDNGIRTNRTNMKAFLNHLKEYINSLRFDCKRM